MAKAAGNSDPAYKLSFFGQSPPVACIALARLIGTELELYADPKLSADALPALHISYR